MSRAHEREEKTLVHREHNHPDPDPLFGLPDHGLLPVCQATTVWEWAFGKRNRMHAERMPLVPYYPTMVGFFSNPCYQLPPFDENVSHRGEAEVHKVQIPTKRKVSGRRTRIHTTRNMVSSTTMLCTMLCVAIGPNGWED